VAIVRDAGETADRGLSSFEAFYRAEYAPVVRLAFALTGRQVLAEELAQDGFLACHQRWDSVSAYENPSAWVRRVVTNRCVSSGRRHLTELRLVARLRRERSTALTIEAGSAELWSIVRNLPKRQAQTLALVFVEDLAVHEVAAILEIGEESVRTHLRRGRTAVAARLKETSVDD
jgi:RNA polymerase sigma-70 factor (ECF subfamily)